MKTIKVNLGNRSYSILIGQNTIAKLPSLLGQFFPTKHLAVLTNTTLARVYRKKIDLLLKKKFTISWIVIPDGEKYKTLKTVETIYHQLVKSGATRKTGLVALGGGVVGDIGGFVAATYLRGIPYIQIPTTLLAMVDSSVGGKTGVDLPFGKNLVGAFNQPRLVVIDTSFLKTLPKREFLCGLAEVVKYGVLGDSRLFEFIKKNADRILKRENRVLEHIISRSCAIKAQIVSQDETESGLRMLLNLGHTVGHAIETLSGYDKIHHGEAVSIGMVYAAFLSWKKGFCSFKDVNRISALLQKLGLPIHWPHYPKNSYQQVIAVDKKANLGKINYVAIKKIGKAVTVELKPDEIVKYL